MTRLLSLGLLLAQSSLALAAASEKPTVDADGTVHIPAFEVPLSRYMSDEAKRRFIEEARKPLTHDSKTNPSVVKMRADVDGWVRPIVERDKALYPVNIEERTLGRVRTNIITPKEGVSARNRNRVLINLHGGGFVVGAGLHGLAESIPVASVGKIKVISVDYRMAPEYHFPAASEDVASVYVQLLREYRAEDIGIYGCSAGGVLTTMTVAWLQKDKLASPGAIGIFSAAAFGSVSGPPASRNSWGCDSSLTAPPLQGGVPVPLVSGTMNYIADTDVNDPLVSPALSPALLSRFPPTLLITGTRARDMSAAVQTQRELTKAGVEADLHLWDGLGHCFFLDADLPESKEAYQVMAHFFDAHLGRKRHTRY